MLAREAKAYVTRFAYDRRDTQIENAVLVVVLASRPPKTRIWSGFFSTSHYHIFLDGWFF